MENKDEILIEAFLEGSLSEAEQKEFEARLQREPALKTQFQLYQEVDQRLESFHKAALQADWKAYVEEEQKKKKPTSIIPIRIIGIIGIAAVILLLLWLSPLSNLILDNDPYQQYFAHLPRDNANLGDEVLDAKQAYDELKYVRLTDFGIYALGLTHKYEPPITTAPYQISLSDHSLTFILNEENETAENLFAPFSQKISSRRYTTNIPLFLKGCNTKTDLKNRVSLFQHAAKGDLPPNWVQFFKDLDQRMNPLQKVTGYELFKIPPHQKELLHLLAVAPEFRTYTLKAADFHLLIPKKSIDQFKKDLKAYGYVMP